MYLNILTESKTEMSLSLEMRFCNNYYFIITDVNLHRLENKRGSVNSTAQIRDNAVTLYIYKYMLYKFIMLREIDKAGNYVHCS